MTYLTLSDIKKQLNIDTQFEDDDTFLTYLGGVAEEMVARHIEHDLEDILINGSLPLPVYQACLLMVGNLYANRESVAFATPSKVPNSYEYLLATYKNRSNFSS